MAGRWGPRLPGEVGVVDGWQVGAATPWRSGGGGWLGRGSPDSLAIPQAVNQEMYFLSVGGQGFSVPLSFFSFLIFFFNLVEVT